MRKLMIVAAVVSLSACSTAGTAAGTVGGAATNAVQTVGGWFGIGDN